MFTSKKIRYCSFIFMQFGQHILNIIGQFLCFHFPIGILGQVWYLMVSFPDLCNLTYFYVEMVS